MARRNNTMMFDGEIIDVAQPNQRPEMMYISEPSPFVEEMTFGRGGASNLNFRGNQGGRGISLPSQPYLRMAPNRSTICLLYTSPSPRDGLLSRMPSSA